jgi:ribosomal protein S10
MQTTEIDIFGAERDSVREAVSKIRGICDKKGIEYKGPHPKPVVDLEKKPADLADDGVELFGEVPSEREIALLSNEEIYSRTFELHRYASDDVAKAIAKQDYPDEVFLRITVRETEFIGADQGHVPFSYNPNQDYNTEL